MHCRFKIKWLDTADRGHTAVLPYEDICLLDARPLSSHPLYPQLKAALGPAASTQASANAVPSSPGKVQTRLQKSQGARLETPPGAGRAPASAPPSPQEVGLI